MRRSHLLKSNKTNAGPTHVCFVDTESYQEVDEKGDTLHTLQLGVACYLRLGDSHNNESQQWFQFHTASEFWSWLESLTFARMRMYVVSHNLNFDFPILDSDRELTDRGFELLHFYKKGMTTLLRYRRDRTTLQFVDNTNLFATDLRTLGETMAVRKKSVDFADVDEVTLFDYCKRDVEVLVEAWRSWLDFLAVHDLGVFGCTLASQSFNAFRHRFMSHEIFIHNNEPVVSLERQAYQGGRTEVWKQGSWNGQTFYKLDVNAMYPFVMREFEYPRRLMSTKKDISLVNLDYLLERYCVIATVDVNVDESVYPLAVNGWRSYPIGRFRTTLTSEELRYALDRWWIEAVHEVAIYAKERIFIEFVDFVWELESKAKREGDRVLRYQCKLMRNSLYGKFGQRGLQRKCTGDATSLLADKVETYVVADKEWVEEYNFCGKRWEDRIGEAAFNTFVAISAHVTANARLYLHEIVTAAVDKNVYYCDTDSVIVNERGYQNLAHYLDENALGKLKVEDQADSLSIYAAKDYQLGEKVTLKGIKKDAKSIGGNAFLQSQWPSLLRTMRTRTPSTIKVTQVLKVLEREIHTGVIRVDGTVVPFEIVEDDTGMRVLNDPAIMPL